jgi:hypothetical protein
VNQPPTGVDHPRNPRDSPLYTLVEDHFDHFEQIDDDVYARDYGFWRPIIREVVDKYLDCGDLHCGFARVRCASCAQTYGRTCNYHPHLHLLATDGVFDHPGIFYPLPHADTRQLEVLFRHKVLQRLLTLDKIPSARVELLLSWKHSGFSVHHGRPVQPGDTQEETVTAYLLHAPISQQRMHYDPSSGTVRY